MSYGVCLSSSQASRLRRASQTTMGSTPPAFKSPYGPPGTPVDTRKQIHFATDGVQPPAALYMDPNDRLFVEYITTDLAGNISVRYRFLNAAGEIIQAEQAIPAPPVARATSFTFIPLTEGFLLNLEVSVSGPNSPTTSRGAARASVRLIRGSTGVQLSLLLCQGYVDTTSKLTWPGGWMEPSANGAGNIRSITGTTPAAGAEISETVPTVARFGFRTFRFQLTTSAAVFTRAVTLVIDDGVNTLFQIEAPSGQAASLVQQYNFGAIGARADKVNTTAVAIPFPNITLNAGYRIRTVTGSLQAGDQYTAPQYNVEDWICP